MSVSSAATGKRTLAEYQPGALGAFLSSASSCSSPANKKKRAKVDHPHKGDAHGEILVSNLMKVLRRHKRRICAMCARTRPLEEDRFPVCWCGAQRYCGEKCQEMAWKLHHSRTCASGNTWSHQDLVSIRYYDQELADAAAREQYPAAAAEESMQRYVTAMKKERQEIIAKNPPPADRER